MFIKTPFLSTPLIFIKEVDNVNDAVTFSTLFTIIIFAFIIVLKQHKHVSSILIMHIYCQIIKRRLNVL